MMGGISGVFAKLKQGVDRYKGRLKVAAGVGLAVGAAVLLKSKMRKKNPAATSSQSDTPSEKSKLETAAQTFAGLKSGDPSAAAETAPTAPSTPAASPSLKSTLFGGAEEEFKRTKGEAHKAATDAATDAAEVAGGVLTEAAKDVVKAARGKAAEAAVAAVVHPRTSEILQQWRSLTRKNTDDTPDSPPPHGNPATGV